MMMLSQPDPLTRELELMRERYAKLVDAHGQLQLRNTFLEERVLNIVDVTRQDQTHLEDELIAAKQQIFRLQETVQELQVEKQRYKDDCNLAVRLLHRHPNEFLSTAANNQESSSEKGESHSLLMPTFPPTFVASLPSVSNHPPSPSIPGTNLRLAESLFKSNSVHRFPSVQYLCSECRRTVKCSDVSVQTNARLRLLSPTTSEDGLVEEKPWVPVEVKPLVQGPFFGYTRRVSQEKGSSPCTIPGMHHV